MGHVHLHVGDLAEAVRFYGDVVASARDEPQARAAAEPKLWLTS